MRLAAATTPLETVWLYYDLARDNVKLKKWDLSRFYARKALNMAQSLRNPVWETNVQLLITKSLVLQRNRNEAKNELKRTKEIALQLKFDEVINFLERVTVSFYFPKQKLIEIQHHVGFENCGKSRL